MPAARRKIRDDYVFKAVRISQTFWDHLELIAARECVSMNSVINALLRLALDIDQDEEGRDAIHAACTQWRTRWEHKLTARRAAKAAADDPTLD